MNRCNQEYLPTYPHQLMHTFEGFTLFTVFVEQLFVNIEKMVHTIKLSDFQLQVSEAHVSKKQAELFGPLSDMLELGILWTLEEWVQELLDCLQAISHKERGRKQFSSFSEALTEPMLAAALRKILLKFGQGRIRK